VIDVDGLELILDAKLCLEFMQILDLDWVLSAIEFKGVVGVDGKIQARFQMLQVDLLFGLYQKG
jgi:hypothetical protein